MQASAAATRGSVYTLLVLVLLAISGASSTAAFSSRESPSVQFEPHHSLNPLPVSFSIEKGGAVPRTSASAGTWSCQSCGRELPSSAYDAADGYLVAFGGIEYETPNLVGKIKSSFPGDTLKFQNGQWNEVATSTAPSARVAAGMTYDARDGYVLLFGGYDSRTIPLNDTWKFVNGNWTQLFPARSPPPSYSSTMSYDAADGYVVLVESGCWPCSQSTWNFSGGNWTPVPSKVTPLVTYGVSAYDSADKEVILYGGSPYGGNATWGFAGGTWTNLTNPNATGPWVTGEVLSDDPSDGYLIQAGGVNQTNKATNQTWKFAGGNWTKLATSKSVPLRWFSSAAYDPNLPGVVLFAGVNASPYVHVFSVTNIWAYTSGNWSSLTPPVPGARYAPGLVFDIQAGELVLYGGVRGTRLLDDTWTLNGTSWTRIHSKASPGPRLGFQMAYDDVANATILFGGYDGSYLNDTWRFYGGSWSRLLTANAPPGREFGSMVYDSADGYLLLFGGDAGGYLADTWTFSNGNWINRTAGSVHAPGPRYGSAIAYDGSTSSVVLFGGYDGVELSDTWNFRNGSWGLVVQLTHPPARVFGSMTYDGVTSGDVLFGGYGGAFLADTWEYRSGSWHHLHLALHPVPREMAGFARSSASGSIALFGGYKGAALSDLWEFQG